LVERIVDFLKSFSRNSLAQDSFSTQISDHVEGNAAQRRAKAGQQNVKQEVMPILIYVGGNECVYRHSEKSRVGKRKLDDAPYHQRHEELPDPSCVSLQNFVDAFQTGWISLLEVTR